MQSTTEVGGIQVGYESGIAFAHVPDIGDGTEWNLNLHGIFLHEWVDRVEASPCNDLQKAFLIAKLEWLEHLRDREYEEISRPPMAVAVARRVAYLPIAAVWAGLFVLAILVLALLAPWLAGAALGVLFRR